MIKVLFLSFALTAFFTNAEAQDGIDREDVSPMLTTQWGMDAPYNALCPNGCPTGCTAVATSQVMNYYQHPVRGTGKISYAWGTETLSADFSQSTYDWANMLSTVKTTSPEASKTAVAQLMRDVGYADRMQYAQPESTGYLYDMGYGLATYFGYDKGVSFLLRKMYTDDEWDEMLYAELKAGRPVVYSGYYLSGGHTFVLDGYMDGKYHVNWGWDGQYDGYYALDKLMSYTLSQEALLGIRPDQGTKDFATLLYNFAKFETEATSYSKSGNIKFMGQFTNRSFTTKTFRYGVECVSKMNGKSTFAESTKDNTRAPLEYYSNYQVAISNMPSSPGTYYVYPAYRDDQGVWHRMRTEKGLQSNVTCSISISKITFSAGIADDIEEVKAVEKPRMIYSLDGRRLSAIPEKGIFIINGKKMVK